MKTTATPSLREGSYTCPLPSLLPWNGAGRRGGGWGGTATTSQSLLPRTSRLTQHDPAPRGQGLPAGTRQGFQGSRPAVPQRRRRGRPSSRTRLPPRSPHTAAARPHRPRQRPRRARPPHLLPPAPGPRPSRVRPVLPPSPPPPGRGGGGASPSPVPVPSLPARPSHRPVDLYPATGRAPRRPPRTALLEAARSRRSPAQARGQRLRGGPAEIHGGGGGGSRGAERAPRGCLTARGCGRGRRHRSPPPPPSGGAGLGRAPPLSAAAPPRPTWPPAAAGKAVPCRNAGVPAAAPGTAAEPSAGKFRPPTDCGGRNYRETDRPRIRGKRPGTALTGGGGERWRGAHRCLTKIESSPRALLSQERLGKDLEKLSKFTAKGN